MQKMLWMVADGGVIKKCGRLYRHCTKYHSKHKKVICQNKNNPSIKTTLTSKQTRESNMQKMLWMVADGGRVVQYYRPQKSIFEDTPNFDV
jgi:hypothetical protein